MNLFPQSKINSKRAYTPYSASGGWFFNINDTVNGNWNYLTQMPLAMYCVPSYYWPDSNAVFIAGGANDFGTAQSYCFFYKIASNTYIPKSILPEGRFSGKLVRVADSLYLVGSANTSFIPDGALYRYDPHSNTWQMKASTPFPLLQEMAVCVWRDSLIITIGGSTGGFNGGTKSVRVYDPLYDIWSILPNSYNLFPDTITTADAECIGNNIVVVGGFGMTLTQTIYRGYIPSTNYIDSLSWLPDTASHPFPPSTYRVGGGAWANYMYFGPALYHDSVCLSEIWSFNIADSSWTRILPNPRDTVANIPTLAIRPEADSIYFYIFGGTLNRTLETTANTERGSIPNPLIGITENNKQVPKEYNLGQNYPNPFNPSTTISFEIPAAGFVRLVIYDVLGREVKVLVNEYRRAGYYKIEFNSISLASGVYFYRISAGDFHDTKKMILLK